MATPAGSGAGADEGFDAFAETLMFCTMLHGRLHDMRVASEEVAQESRYRLVRAGYPGTAPMPGTRVLGIEETTRMHPRAAPERQASAGPDSAAIEALAILNAWQGTAAPACCAIWWLTFRPTHDLAGEEWEFVQAEVQQGGASGALQREPAADPVWTHIAAMRDDVWIQYQIGLLYEQGTGLPQSDVRAVRWYSRAALSTARSGLEDCISMPETEANGSAAKCALAEKYQQGRGLVQDSRRALFWYERAAAEGSPVAQYILGMMYHSGAGVAQDTAKAAELLRQAAAQGHDEARQALERLG